MAMLEVRKLFVSARSVTIELPDGGLYNTKKPYRILNLGYGGDRTQHVIWRMENGELEGYRAKLFTLMIGTNNNSSKDTKPENVASAIEQLVAKIRAKQPKAKIVLHPIFPRGNSAKSARHADAQGRNVKTNVLLKQFADRDGKIIWIDFNDKLVDASGWVPKLMPPPWTLGQETLTSSQPTCSSLSSFSQV